MFTTISPVMRSWAVMDSSRREWSSSQLMISTSVPSATRQWVKSDCHVSLGWSAAKRRIDDLGRFFGSGVINPAVCRMRLIVEVDGGVWPSIARYDWILTGPWSKPVFSNAMRS